MKLKNFFGMVLLVLIAAGSQPAIGAFWQWSKTTATNATADPSINWAEGMSPSSINDSGRAMMARAAEYRDDISGALALAGSSTVYTVTTNQTLCVAPASTTTPTTGQMLAFVPNVTNGIAPTLKADGCNAFPFQVTAGTALPAGTIVGGTPYRASFSGTAWVLEAGYGNPYAVPLGGLLDSTIATPPNSNFILPAGQCISSTTYNAYFVALGSPASGGCAGGQFAVIDMRGRVSAALDNLNGSPASRLTTAGCGVTFQTMGLACTSTETVALGPTNMAPYTPSGSVVLNSLAFNSANISSTGGGGPGNVTVGGFSTTGPLVLNAPTSSLTFTGTAGPGTSAPFARVQPTVGVYRFLRVI